MTSFLTILALALIAWSVLALGAAFLVGRVFRMAAENTAQPVCAKQIRSDGGMQ